MVKLNSTFGWLMVVIFLLTGVHSAALPPIIQAVKDGDMAETRSLIDGKVDVNEHQADGPTALHWAVHRNNPDAVRMLIQAGAEVDVINDFGVNPISLACVNRNPEVAKLLLKRQNLTLFLLLLGKRKLTSSKKYVP